MAPKKQAPKKLSIADLKKECKAKGLPQSGEKSDLEDRLETFALGELNKLAGTNPCMLKAGELKKALAQRGLPCDLSINTRDELNAALVAALQKEGPASGGQQDEGSEDERPLSDRRQGASSAGGKGTGASDVSLAVEMAKKVATKTTPAPRTTPSSTRTHTYAQLQ